MIPLRERIQRDIRKTLPRVRNSKGSGDLYRFRAASLGRATVDELHESLVSLVVGGMGGELVDGGRIRRTARPRALSGRRALSYQIPRQGLFVPRRETRQIVATAPVPTLQLFP